MGMDRDDLEFMSYIGRQRILSRIEQDNHNLIWKKIEAGVKDNEFVVFRTAKEASEFHKLSLPAYLIYIRSGIDYTMVRIKFDGDEDTILFSVSI